MAATRPAPRKPAAKPFGAFGSRREIDEKYLFGTQAEINNRIATGYPTPPEDAVPSFSQIRPGPTSKNANEPAPADYSNDTKYGSPRRYA